MGKGTSLDIWSDPWIPLGVTRRPATPRGSSLLTKVSELIDPLTGSWDEHLVNDTFWERDAEIILSMATDDNSEDWPAWHFNPKGDFSENLRTSWLLAKESKIRQRMHRDQMLITQVWTDSNGKGFGNCLSQTK